jgi:hypothetical protein
MSGKVRKEKINVRFIIAIISDSVNNIFRCKKNENHNTCMKKKVQKLEKKVPNHVIFQITFATNSKKETPIEWHLPSHKESTIAKPPMPNSMH